MAEDGQKPKTATTILAWNASGGVESLPKRSRATQHGPLDQSPVERPTIKEVYEATEMERSQAQQRGAGRNQKRGKDRDNRRDIGVHRHRWDHSIRHIRRLFCEVNPMTEADRYHIRKTIQKIDNIIIENWLKKAKRWSKRWKTENE